MEIDPLIQILRERPGVLELLGRIWEILYIEGSTPDVGTRRQNVIQAMLREELGLEVKPSPSIEGDGISPYLLEGKREGTVLRPQRRLLS